jgi:hypothetical protein
MKFHSFYTENLSHIYEDHKKCCDKLGLDVVYYKDKRYNDYNEVYSAHGNFMTSVLQNESDDIIGFLDIDCLPHHKENIEKAYEWVKEYKAFSGNAQSISHTSTRNRLYAAASFLIICKSAWKQLGSPSLTWFDQDNIQVDTAQLLSLRADEIGFPYQLMYPIGYDEDNPEHCFTNLSGITTHKRMIGTYGFYGTGTLYPATYHYFRGSELTGKIPDIWMKRVSNILNDQKIIPNHSSCFYDL